MKIIMYHYIKNFSNTEFSRLKGLDLEQFKFQIKYLKSKYEILNPIDIHEIIAKKKELKSNYCWLTFDDGYIDHYQNVIPVLEENKLKASFFPPVKSTLQNTILDVNKIHLILAKNNNYEMLLKEVEEIFCKNGSKNETDLFKNLLKSINTNNRFDDINVILLKRLLQRELPKEIRLKICEILFKKYVSKDSKLLSKKFYMSLSQIKEIFKLGHEIGIHGYEHDWYGRLNKKDQKSEILKSLMFWKNNGLLKEKFSFCYPYGDYNKDTLNILRELKCSLGLTTKAMDTSLKNYSPLELPRLDTNDFPQ